jgi:hypothetical protein
MKAGTFLLYADLQPEGLAALDAARDEDAAKATLSQLLSLGGQAKRMEVLLELYMNALRFARAHSFSVEKTSTFFSIIKRNHEEMAEAFLPPHKSWEFLKALLLMHSVQRPPHSVGIFTLSEVQLITKFALENYYDHFKLYRYAFTLKHVKQVDVRTSWQEQPPDSFPPLSEGLPVEPEPEPEPEPPAYVEPPPIELNADVSEAVKAAVEAQIAAQVAAIKANLEAQYAQTAAAHQAKLAALEAKVK